MDTPGLLPEESGPRPSPLRWVLGVLVLVFLLMIGLMAVLLVRFKAERDKSRARIDELLGEARRPVPAVRPESPSLARRVEELEARLAQLEAARRAEPPPAPAAPASGFREAPTPPVRSAETEAMIYIHVSAGFAARGHVTEAVRALGEALRLDPAASWRVPPRALFSSPEEFEKLMAELERRVRENPLDVEAKTVLAYLYFHEKGADPARALLLQVLAVNPDHAVAKRLLENLER